MEPIEIIVIIACAAIVVGVVAGSIVRRAKDKKSGNTGCSGRCSSCSYCKNKPDIVEKQ